VNDLDAYKYNIARTYVSQRFPKEAKTWFHHSSILDTGFQHFSISDANCLGYRNHRNVIKTVLHIIGRVYSLRSHYEEYSLLHGQLLGNDSRDLTKYNIGQTCHQIGPSSQVSTLNRTLNTPPSKVFSSTLLSTFVTVQSTSSDLPDDTTIDTLRNDPASIIDTQSSIHVDHPESQGMCTASDCLAQFMARDKISPVFGFQPLVDCCATHSQQAKDSIFETHCSTDGFDDSQYDDSQSNMIGSCVLAVAIISRAGGLTVEACGDSGIVSSASMGF
jgi:hypothetical protein